MYKYYIYNLDLINDIFLLFNIDFITYTIFYFIYILILSKNFNY